MRTAAVIDKIGEFLQKNVTPYLKPIFNALDKPVSGGHPCF